MILPQSHKKHIKNGGGSGIATVCSITSSPDLSAPIISFQDWLDWREMSIAFMIAVWQLKIPPHEKLVLLALADHARDNGLCWPSVDHLAEKCSLSDRQIQRTIRKLQEKGFLLIEPRRGRSNNYQLGVTPMSPASDTHVTHNHNEPSEPVKCERKFGHKWHSGCSVLPAPYWIGTGKAKCIMNKLAAHEGEL